MGKISQNTAQTNAILEKHFIQASTSQLSVQQSLSDISAINQNLAQIGILSQNSQNFVNRTIPTSSPINVNQDNPGLASFLQALNQGSAFPVLNGSSVPQPVISVTSSTFSTVQSNALHTSTYQKMPNVGLTSLVSSNRTITNVSENVLGMPKIATLAQTQTTQSNQSSPAIISNPTIQSIGNQIQNLNQNMPGINTHFNISNPFQVQNFGGQNLFLNQGTNTIIAPNIPNFSGNITINNGLIPNNNLTVPNNILPNFLQTNIVQQTTDVNVQRTGGFKLALSEDGRLILQHDPNLNQDIQSQLLLQSIFGISIPGNNLVLTSVNNPTPPVQPPQVKPIAVVEPKKQEITTKTTNIIHNPITVSSVQPCDAPNHQTVTAPSITPTSNNNNNNNNSGGNNGGNSNNFSYIVNLTPEQLETLKRNGQLTVNGQTIFMHRPKGQENEKLLKNSSPKTKNIKKKIIGVRNSIDEPLGVKTSVDSVNKIMNSVSTQSSIPNLISALQSPAKNIIGSQVIIINITLRYDINVFYSR